MEKKMTELQLKLENERLKVLVKSLTESLVLMSLSKVIIIANSSFSWWAAKTGTGKEMVIAPKPWFRNLENPSSLIPDLWIQIKSDWM
jgi:hypothetical protein